MEPRTLTPADCPLLAGDPAGDAGELLDLANACGRLLSDLAAGDLRAVLDRDDGRKLAARFAAARDHLTRPHYRVGFLGTSSAGKSTVFNLVLGEPVAESGSGQATTSLPSRLRHTDGPRRCVLVSMTEGQYRDRLKKLCLEVGIGSPPENEDDLLAMLAQLKPTAAADDPAQRPIRKDDLVYLRAFVESYRAHRGQVRAGEPVAVEVPFEARSAYINHSYTRPQAAADGPLLAEARLFVPNPNLPDRLELCDLPGLNASRSVDAIVTRDFIHHQLDGALVFVNAAENLASAVVKDVLARLAARYGDDLAGRAWVVLNKADTLTRPHYVPAPGQRSVFESILDLTREARIPVSQVCFTSRKLIEAANAGQLTPASAASLLSLPDGPVPATCPPELRPAWEELLRDGGVGRLRHLILNEVARSVAAAIRTGARGELARLRDDITALAEAEKRRRTGGPALREKAVQCRNTVLRLREGLAGPATDFPVLAELRDYLRGKLAALLCPDARHAETLRGVPPARLRQQFTIDARNLDEALADVLATEAIDRVYQKVGEHLESLPAVPVGRYVGIGEAWQDFRRADQADVGPVPRFASDELFGGAGYEPFDGETYLDLMREKVRVAVAQVVHGLRARIRSRLGELEVELDRLLMPGQPDL